MLLGRENEAIKLIASHIDKVEDCLQSACRAVEASFADSPETAFLLEQVHLADKDARAMQQEIIRRLYRGAFMPILREDIYNVVKCMGRLARCADTLCSFMACNRPLLPEELQNAFKRSIQKIFTVIGPIKKGFQSYWRGYGKIAEIQDMSERIESTQIEVAGMTCELNRRILEADLEPCRKMLLKDCLDEMTAVLAAAGDASAHMERITLKTGF